MLNGNNHSEQFERYLKGEMSPEEAHTFEHEVLNDPFAQEALEGYEMQGVGAIDDLKKLKNQTSSQQKRQIPFMRIAAVVALLIVGSYTVYMFTDQIEGEQLAMEKEPIEETLQNAPKPDTVMVTGVQEENIVEDDQLAEEAKSETFEQDGLRVEKKDDDVIELAIDESLAENEEDGEDDFFLAEVVEEVPGEVKIEEAEIDLDDALQGRVAGIQIAKADKPVIDTNALTPVEIVPQTLVAKESADQEYRSAKSKKRSESDAAGAVARSAIEPSQLITGKVTDDTGEPLPGVNVVIKGTTTGATTDLDGNYSLPKSGDMTLVFSYVGFETSEIQVGNRNTVDAVMGGAMELQEVVVTGVGASDGDDNTFQSAAPINGRKSYKEYLENNLSYPESARENNIEGTVVLELNISTSGSIDSMAVKKSLGYGCDEEAIRLVNEGPSWEPAKRGNTPTVDKVRVKVKFRLD